MPLTRAQAREYDRLASEEYGMPSLLLMENAGRGTAELLQRLNPERAPVTVCCGKGNNGGDGFVIARHLENHGLPVRVLLFAEPDQLTGDAAVNFRILERAGTPLLVPVLAGMADADFERWLTDHLSRAAGWVVDALFGTGLSGPIRGRLAQVVAAVNAAPARVLAVDIPSGLDADTGEPLGPTVQADHTATFVAPKQGFDNPTAREWLGEVHVLDIGAPRALLEFRL
jgi:NAD(P)H-hydrate epimerase